MSAPTPFIKKPLAHALFGSVLAFSGNLSADGHTERDATFDVYVVNGEANADKGSSSGLGVMYDSEQVKVKLEGTSDVVRTGAVVKLNPNDGNAYIKIGGNYVNQKMYAPDDTNERVDQYSAALAAGYMLQDDLYAELGASYTDLNGEEIGTLYEIEDETTKRAYVELAKRWHFGSVMLDTTLNAGRVMPEHSSNKDSYGLGIDLYPTDASKLSYQYLNEDGNTLYEIEAQAGYGFVSYSKNLSQDTYEAKVGVKFTFDNLFDTSSYGKPMNIKPHLSELHAFEQMVLSSNMRIQSSQGVQLGIVNFIEENTTPSAMNGSINGGFSASANFSLIELVEDAETPKAELTLIIVNPPQFGELTVHSINSVDYAMDVFESGNDFFTYKVRDPEGLESPVMRFDLLNFDNG